MSPCEKVCKHLVKPYTKKERKKKIEKFKSPCSRHFEIMISFIKCSVGPYEYSMNPLVPGPPDS